MSDTTAVDALAGRIRAIDWSGGPDRTRSRVALMREYLRRAALWTRAVQGRGWPFYDVAAFAAPGVRADDGVVRGVLGSPAIVEQDPAVGRSCAWALHLAAARDAGVSLPDLPDLFEPLIRMYERGGGFSLSGAGTIDIDAAGLYRGTLLDHLGDEPRAPGTDAELDALDGIAPRAAAPEEVAAPPAYPSAAYAVSVPETAAAPVREAPPAPAAAAAQAARAAAPGPPEAPVTPGVPGAPTMLPPAPGHPSGAYPQPGPYAHGGYPGHPAPGHVPPAQAVRLRHHTHWNPDDPTVGLAEPWQRFFARFVDTVLVGVLWFLLMLATTFTAVIIGGGDIVGESAEPAFQIGAVFSFAVFPILWEWFQVCVWGRSVGKMLLGLWVVRAEGGGKPPAGRALLRALCFAPGFTNIVNWLLPWSLTNVLWSLRDKERRRCLHDRFTRSVVVQVG
ncbi:RDD family protein [Nocardiopsis sp. CC223A]|uniref:RDD family protein n=1 Tax=Nocardiopsis sp. CC223A TaxID=3044051 RepID=UPI00278C1150|nr:RDD family protein [Nocardiopsis sp. CC223A]